MAWPPPAYPLDTTFSNSTPQLNTHADTHVEIGATLNEIVDEFAVRQARLDGLQTGEFSGTTDANGRVSIFFPAAYAAPPTVVVIRRSTALGVRGCHLASQNTTTRAQVTCWNEAGFEGSQTVIVQWFAWGVLA